MSRVTAPASKLSRAISSSASATRANPLLDSTAHTHNAGAVLMPKYAELLRNRSSEHTDSSRGLTTAHRPTPQPSLANRSKPLMQTFHTTTTSAKPSSTIDAAVLPSTTVDSAPERAPIVPILPDNFSYTGAHHDVLEAAPDTATAGVFPTIVAADPDNVIAMAPLSEVQGIGLDGVELKFAHEHAAAEEEAKGGMFSDIWRGMVDDVFGPNVKRA